MNKLPKPEDITKAEEKPICGIIMPIAGNDGYTAEHWVEVKNIISNVILNFDYTPKLVSDADDVGLIHNRIVTNIAENPIVVCDVSSKNPNVMFELGMRLAFDKPTIIIKDELTNYSFDTGVIEHLTYPSSLHYPTIVTFKKLLESKLRATIKASEQPNYSTFLKNYVSYKRELETKEISNFDYIIKKIDFMSEKLSKLERHREQENLLGNSIVRVHVNSTFDTKIEHNTLAGMVIEADLYYGAKLNSQKYKDNTWNAIFSIKSEHQKDFLTFLKSNFTNVELWIEGN